MTSPSEPFGAYARFYNLFYQEKDYPAEAAFVAATLRRHHPAPLTLLDLGCGTGNHLFALARLGFATTGVDRSAGMLEAALARRAAQTWEGATPPQFHSGDIRTVRLEQRFAAVVLLFHVMSYLPTNQELRQALTTAHHHLEPGGVLLFDCWYGPGVLADPPVVRVKRFTTPEATVVRIATPTIHRHANLVDVETTLIITESANQRAHEVTETHRMRYLFHPEVAALLEGAGFELIGFQAFMREEPPALTEWNACFTARKLP